MALPAYRIYALQYADRETNSSEVFYADDRHAPMQMAYFVWVVSDGSRSIVVDLGFTEPVGTRRGRRWIQSPGDALQRLGVDPSSVEHVIVTHFHYDHTGNHALFPRATFHVQDSEMRFYTGRYARNPAFLRSLTIDDIVAFVRYNYDGRVQFVDGEREIVPGIRVHWVGGHTAGMQIVSVDTSRGRAVLASDASHYYANLEENRPFATLHDLPNMYAAFQRIRDLAAVPELILPGHDPLVRERLGQVKDGIYEL
jgi:glyoxylase-like metal-dependent hydrolase (beta-lactamase superfamily II)